MRKNSKKTVFVLQDKNHGFYVLGIYYNKKDAIKAIKQDIAPGCTHMKLSENESDYLLTFKYKTQIDNKMKVVSAFRVYFIGEYVVE